MGSAVRLSSRAREALRPGEALAFDWSRVPVCCAVAGEVSLRRTTVDEARRRAFVPLAGGVVFAHRRAYLLLAGRDVRIDCRRRLGVRWFSSDLPPDLGLRASFGQPSRLAERPDGEGASHERGA